ncbi:MAG: shikimate dehydrogenase [Acidobacteria bacterium]|nr:MAG: shikimate dehydrogenase [Acidobacteriota bacterium]
MLRIALFGHPVGHSRSAELFGALAAAGGPPVDYRPVDVPPGGLQEAFERLRAGEWDGANVTIPHKVEACRLADELDAAARAAGAANVLVRRAGRIAAANTDGAGFLDALRLFPELGSLRGLSVLILGAGGAARGVAAALTAEGAEVTVVSRDPAKRAAWAGHLARRVVGWDDPELASVTSSARLVVQATPLGMAPYESALPPLPLEAVGPGHRAVDLVYEPWETPFLAAVRDRGAAAINGWPMLVHQAARAALLWGGPAAAGRLLAAARELEARDPFRAGA